jgi:hypothetical protein
MPSANFFQRTYPNGLTISRCRCGALWEEVKNTLLRRYGNSEEEVQQILLAKLSAYKQTKMTPLKIIARNGKIS